MDIYMFRNGKFNMKLSYQENVLPRKENWIPSNKSIIEKISKIIDILNYRIFQYIRKQLRVYHNTFTEYDKYDYKSFILTLHELKQ